LLEAQKLYAGGKKKQGFPFLHCWQMIRHSEKFVPPVTNKRPRESNSPPGTVDVFDLEDGESNKSQTPDSAMPSSKRPMGRKQAKEKLKKGGEPTNYNLIEKFLKSISSSSPVPPIPIKLPYWGHLCFFLTPAVPQYLFLFFCGHQYFSHLSSKKGGDTTPPIP